MLLLLSAAAVRHVAHSQSCGRASDGKVYMAGVFDTAHLDTIDHFQLAVSMIKDRNDGWHDDLLTDTALETVVEDGGCDGAVAGPAYYKMKNQWGAPLHGIVGCRCSGASMAVGRIAGLEKVNQISFSSTSAKLSDEAEFPYFSRVVPPDNEEGGVGALVALLRHFDWTDVNVLYTDTQYTRGLHTEFSKAWKHDHGSWEGTILEEHALTYTGAGKTIDLDRAKVIFDSVFAIRPFSQRSKVVVLMAHNQDAFPLLKFVSESGDYPDDTIWIGTDGWTDKMPTEADGGTSWMPTNPGYLGVVPLRSGGPEYQTYLQRLNAWEVSKGKAKTSQLPVYAAETVDAVVAMAKALTGMPHSERSDGAKVRARIRALKFDGVGGSVAFTPQGDRASPRFTVMNLADKSGWKSIGSIGLTADTAKIDTGKICWVESGCGEEPPSDLGGWGWGIFLLIGIGVIAVAMIIFLLNRYRKQRQAKRDAIQKLDEALKEMDTQKLDDELGSVAEKLEKAKQEQQKLMQARANLQQLPKEWDLSVDPDQHLVPIQPSECVSFPAPFHA